MAKKPSPPTEILPNANGQITVLHGTSNAFEKFDFGFRDQYYFAPVSRPDQAEGYGKSKSNIPSTLHPNQAVAAPRVIEAELTMKNPWIVDRRKLGDVVKARNMAEVAKRGHDGVILWDSLNPKGRETEYIATKSTGISIKNVKPIAGAGVAAVGLAVAAAAISAASPASASAKPTEDKKKEPELRSYTPTLGERVSNFIKGDALPSPERRRLAEGTATILGALPGTGTVMALEGAARRGSAQDAMMSVIPGGTFKRTYTTGFKAGMTEIVRKHKP